MWSLSEKEILKMIVDISVAVEVCKREIEQGEVSQDEDGAYYAKLRGHVQAMEHLDVALKAYLSRTWSLE